MDGTGELQVEGFVGYFLSQNWLFEFLSRHLRSSRPPPLL